MGGAIAAIESGYMKRALVESNAERLRAIEAGETKVVGVNAFTSSEPSPLATEDGEAILAVAETVEYEQIEKLKAWRAARDNKAVAATLSDLETAARESRNIMQPSIACAKAGVTTGEWGATLRRVFGEYRAPTGVTLLMRGEASQALTDVRQAVEALARKLGMKPRFLVGKPGLDGHSNGAEQIAVRAADCGFEVSYEGIRLTPEQIVAAALEHGVHVVGLSILSGSHVPLVRDVMNRMRAMGLGHVPVVAGGIIPPEDVLVLKQLGIARVYTPKDFDLNRIMTDLVKLIDGKQSERAA
jgi:(2R)-ethylmalonyl-CoA mutase